MDRSALSKAQLTICEALGLNARDLVGLHVEMSVGNLTFTARGYVYGSDGKPIAIASDPYGSDVADPATFQLQTPCDHLNAIQSLIGNFISVRNDGDSYYLVVDGLRGEYFPTVDAALAALPRMGDELRKAKRRASH